MIHSSNESGEVVMPRTEAANQRIREEQRAKILDAARTVFARKGRAATMADIAAEAHVSQGLAYRYFASKDAIFRELLQQLARSGAPGQRALEASGTPGERLAILLTRIIASQRERPGFFQVVNQTVRDEETPDDVRMLVRGMYQRLLGTLRQLIVEGQATGEVAAGDPDQLVTVVSACLDGLTRLAANDPERFNQQVPDAEIVLRMLKPCRERGTEPGP
jgi:AcrR family transcriptional regulator